METIANQTDREDFSRIAAGKNISGMPQRKMMGIMHADKSGQIIIIHKPEYFGHLG